MKKKGFKRILTICMCAAMLIESVNVSTFTVKAGTADAITQDSELKDAVENGENADQAAYEAAQKAAEAAAEAEAAAKAAKELGEAAADAALDPDAAQAPALKEEIDKEISDAETAVADSNNKIEEESGKLETIAEEAKDKTAEEAQKAADAADAAQDAAKKAEDLKKQIEAADRADAKLEDVLDAAKQAADEAQAAADQAKEAYGNAQAVLDAAQKKYDDAKAQAEQDIQAGIENADKELEEAEAALAAAEAAVSQAEDAYTAATGSNEIAQKTAEAAAEAAKQAGIADDAAKDAAEAADVADARKTAKEEDNAILEAEKSEIVKAQEDLKSEIAQKENEIKDLNQQIVAKNAEIDATEKAIEDLGWKRFVVETDEYKQAKKLNAQIDALEADIDDLKDDIADANDAIDAKQSEIAKKDTEIAGKDAQIAENNTYIAGIVASQKTVQDFVDNNPDTQITYLDKEKQEEFSTLLKELEASTAKYEDAKELREEYQDATDRSGVGLIEWFKKVYKELKIEAANDNAKIEMDWENLQLVYTNDGLTLLLGKNKDNEQVLLTWENNRLTATKVDEHEFAAYSTAFDAAAAAQASTKAAQAATDAAAARQAEKEALDQYNAAKAALEAARERLAAARKAKLNELQLKAAQEALEQAKQNVEAAKKSYEDAQDAADEAKKAYEDAKDNFDNKPVTARFYILNRGLAQPSEVGHYPAGNYSKVQFGELYKGEDNSYLDQYAKGLKNQDLAAYIKQAPTAEAFGITLKEGESIQWYVIKTENDGIHVDGIILGQKFNVTVHYGYEDEQGNFVKVAEDYTGIYGLGETYDIPSPEVVIDGFKYAAKNATQASVSGTAYSDKEYTVLYHKEEGISVTVNYYRASVTGTLLHSEIRNIGVSQAADYGKSLTASDLNAWRPGDCEDGVLVSYEKTENGYVANIVYTAIPVIPSESGTSGGDGDGEGEGGETGSGTVAEAAGGAGGITAGVVQQVAGARQTTAQETTQIADETTPLAPTVTAAPGKEAGIEAVSSDNNVVSIEDEEAPLAATVNCWIHWLILLLTAIYTIYELVRAIHRNRKINELSGEAGQVEM